MQDNDITDSSNSEWSLLCVLLPKSDRYYRFVRDYCKLNTVIKADSFMIPRIDDCIDKIGNAKYVWKFVCFKGKYSQLIILKKFLHLLSMIIYTSPKLCLLGWKMLLPHFKEGCIILIILKVMTFIFICSST